MEIEIDEFHALQKQICDLQDCCSDWEKQALDYKAKNIALSGELERTCKALNYCIEMFKSLENVLDEKAKASDILDNPDLYAWAVRIKPIWGELKEITGTDYKTEHK